MNRKLVIAAAAVFVVVAVGGVAVRALWFGGSEGSASEPKLPPATAEVTRTTLAEVKTVAGTLGYGDPVPVSAAGGGTLTWVAPAGSTVKRGEPLFKLDERPVVALYGAVPIYRALQQGMTGVDVQQLEENLSALGYTGFTVDDTFTAGTAGAVRAWQRDLGLTATGTVEPGQVVYTPGEIRVAVLTARIGTTGGGEGILSYTGTTRLVTVPLKVADQALAVQGEKVRVTIPGGTGVDGTITKVGTIAAAPQQASETPAPSGSTPTTPGGSATAGASIPVTVEITDQQALGMLEGGPVDVDFASQQREGVLTLPVAALLALPKGGYGVEIVNARTTRVVAVKTGLFAGGRVEISGGGLEAGMKVGMPK